MYILSLFFRLLIIFMLTFIGYAGKILNWWHIFLFIRIPTHRKTLGDEINSGIQKAKIWRP